MYLGKFHFFCHNTIIFIIRQNYKVYILFFNIFVVNQIKCKKGLPLQSPSIKPFYHKSINTPALIYVKNFPEISKFPGNIDYITNLLRSNIHTIFCVFNSIFKHIFNKYSISSCWVIYKYMSNSTYQFAVLYYRAA